MTFKYYDAAKVAEYGVPVYLTLDMPGTLRDHSLVALETYSEGDQVAFGITAKEHYFEIYDRFKRGAGPTSLSVYQVFTETLDHYPGRARPIPAVSVRRFEELTA